MSVVGKRYTKFEEILATDNVRVIETSERDKVRFVKKHYDVKSNIYFNIRTKGIQVDNVYLTDITECIVQENDCIIVRGIGEVDAKAFKSGPRKRLPEYKATLIEFPNAVHVEIFGDMFEVIDIEVCSVKNNPRTWCFWLTFFG